MGVIEASMGNRPMMFVLLAIGLVVGFAGGLFVFDGGRSGATKPGAGNVATLSFSRGAPPGTTLVGVWGKPEQGCVWSEGRGEVRLDMLGIQSSDPVKITIEADGHVSGARPNQSVNVVLNGSLMTTLKYSNAASEGKVSFVAQTLLLQSRTPATLALIEEQAVAPNAIGTGQDVRPRSVCLRRIVIDKVKA
ncbi:MAG TPA: hypothetical protein PK970_01845 [Hyphomicrobiaceae bacterium]|nr:hypothetical protein [Hyphomicrobiaceae bacterium]